MKKEESNKRRQDQIFPPRKSTKKLCRTTEQTTAADDRNDEPIEHANAGYGVEQVAEVVGRGLQEKKRQKKTTKRPKKDRKRPKKRRKKTSVLLLNRKEINKSFIRYLRWCSSKCVHTRQRQRKCQQRLQRRKQSCVFCRHVRWRH